MIMAKIVDGQLNYIKSKMVRNERDAHLEIDVLEAGEYYLFVEFPDLKDNKSFVATYYGQSEAKFLKDEAKSF